MEENKKRKPVVLKMPVTFRAEKDHVVAVFDFGSSTVGIRFESVEMILTFMSGFMQEAVKVWPNNEWVKEYLSD